MMDRLRRILRFLVKGSVALLFVLGLVCLVAWPTSYWRRFSWEVMYEREAPRPTAAPPENLFYFRTRGFGTFCNRGRIGAYYTTYYGDSIHYLLGPPVKSDLKVRDTFPIDDWWRYDVQSYPWGPSPLYHTVVRVVLPLPLVAAVLLAPGVFWLALSPRRRRRYRLASGLCPHCEYSLRGTTGQTCPECGTPRPVTPTTPP